MEYITIMYFEYFLCIYDSILGIYFCLYLFFFWLVGNGKEAHYVQGQRVVWVIANIEEGPMSNSV